MQQPALTDFRASYGPWALVAGASAGLGAEFATQLAAKGLNLVLIARRKELLDKLGVQLVNDYAIEVRALQLDLGREDIDSVITEATSDIDLGLLVYDAAISIMGPLFEATLEDHLNEIAVNCRAPLTLAYLLGQRMLKRRRGGIILFFSSRRRHTSYWRDWSSDVCSSDLPSIEVLLLRKRCFVPIADLPTCFGSMLPFQSFQQAA